MSPKGGIRPHKRFSVQSNRSEVLFVDYIAEHLTPDGRAIVIVPEGIIFQSGTAYKNLRKLLVEKYLVGVISLPAGVFQPYSGVKTSILWLDKVLAKKTDKILFTKIENDGFDLGAQRRTIQGSDLPEALQKISKFKKQIINGFEQIEGTLLLERNKISSCTDYNLIGERYRPKDVILKHELKNLTDVCEFEYGYTASAKDAGNARFIRITDIDKNGSISEKEKKYIDLDEENKRYLLSKGDIIIARTGATYGKTAIYEGTEPSIYASFLIRIRVNPQLLISKYLWALLQSDMYWEQAQRLVTGGGQPQFNANAIKQIQIPIPSLSVQEEIVSELDSYQKIIDGARQVVENYKPRIEIDPQWEMVELGDVCEIKSGGTPGRNIPEFWNGTIPWIGSTVCKDVEVTKAEEYITDYGLNKSAAKLLPEGTTLIALVGATIGKTGYLTFPCSTNQNIGGLIPKKNEILDKKYLFYIAQSLYPKFMELAEGKFRMANLSFIRTLKIPLPGLPTQQDIVKRIDNEKNIVKGNVDLIRAFEQKIKDRIAKVWGE